MNTNKSRQEILGRISAINNSARDSEQNTSFKNEEIYKPILPDAISCFKTELEAISGQCIVCNNDQELVQQLKDVLSAKRLPVLFCRDKAIAEFLKKNDISTTGLDADFETMEAGITACEFLIARTGSLLVTSAGDSGRQMNVFPPVHIVLAKSDQLVDYPENALDAVRRKYADNLPSTITTITGPSRTADIEKTLVLGAHGPKELIVFLSVV